MQQTKWRLVASSRSDVEGRFQAEVEARNNLRVYAYLDLPTTPGIDYVPAYEDVAYAQPSNLTLRLKPGGTVLIEGELRFVESSRDPYSSVFKAVELYTDNHTITDRAFECSTDSLSHTILGLDERSLVVPAKTPMNIIANASVFIGTTTVYRSFPLGQAEAFRLGQGDLLRIRIELPAYRFNLAIVEGSLEQMEQRLNEVENRGFYVTLERQELATFKNLVGSAKDEVAEEAYDAAHADLREAYIGILSTSNRISSMYAEASSSVFVLSLFLSLTAVVISSFMFDRWPLKLLLSYALAAFFFTILFLVYPGTRLVETTSLCSNILITTGITFTSLVAVSFYSDPKLVQILSIAKKNLRKRRTRFLLSLVSVTVLAMSFVTLTSFSTGYGLEISSSTNSSTATGLLVRRPLTKGLPYTVTFLPLDGSTLAWLQSKPGVVSAAPKYENAPLVGNIGVLASVANTTRRLPISGIMGIQPQEEAEIPELLSIVDQGRPLAEGDRGVLVSRKAAEAAGIRVGEELSWSSISNQIRVTVIGLFEDDALRRITDLDSTPVIPEKTVIIPGNPPIIMVESCDPSEVVITTTQVAQEMSIAVGLSRIRVLLEEPSYALSLGRRVALERDLLVWSLDGSKVYRMLVGEYTEAKGLSIMVPWIIVMLNVVITMWNAVFERRKEVAILSSVGLNPTHIGGLFMAEAAVIGFAGGGVGYLLGLGGYRLLSILNIAVEVRQKVSAVWSLASLGISLAAVLVGTGVALRYSTEITPSLVRRWTMGQKFRESGGPVEFSLPFRLRENDVDALFEYVRERVHSQVLSSHASLDPSLVQKMTKVEEKDVVEGHMKTIFFNFAFGQHDTIGAFPFGLFAQRKADDANYALSMVCRGGNAEMMNQCGSYIRMLIVDWSARRNK